MPIALALPAPAFAAQSHDPDWPCVQRKVPELSFPQIWTGPELPESAKDWSKDKQIEALVTEVSARRMPIEEAGKRIRDFAAGLPREEAKTRLPMLVEGLFERMNAERSQVITGIGRYARKQLELASSLRDEQHQLDLLRGKPEADQNQLAAKTDQLTWETRIFEERAQSLTYVCEVPTIIEQRLYALVKTVAEVMKTAVGSRQ
ncbi:hypothetical protein KEU06_06920 [Pseudaminobacter sp. 19-2017]|uniref:Uncharacterized protein n=1 Tax=Pseudaminobacter soli (ex Zhang et al. 2022) TaxID=2831468 RepID=A0A942DW77_9HYPH|nr:hypothetical protein [Pseudaminobacter soli]